MTLELIADYKNRIGENPMWHPIEQRLYWADIANGHLFRYDPITGRHEQCYTGPVFGGFTIQADGALLLYQERGAVTRWQDGRETIVIESLPEEQGNRFNDVIADPAGRVFCGTISIPPGKATGRLYRLDTDATHHVLLDGIGISNGLGFSPDRRCLYYTDSLARSIYAFDYDETTAALSNQRILLQTPEGEGLPDGMTVDAEGHIWSARWDGGALYRYTPEGEETLRIELPAKKVTCLTFGGKDLTDIFITTALAGGTRDQEGSGAGALFKINRGIRGVEEFFSRIA